MANLNEKEKQTSRGFRIAAIMILIVMTIAGTGVYFVYTRIRNMYVNNTASSAAMNTIHQEILNVNSNVLRIVGGFPDTEDYLNNIKSSFRSIEKQEADWEKLEHNDTSIRRYNQMKLYVKAYDDKLLELEGGFSGLSVDIMQNIYTQELLPIQVSATEMIGALEDIGKLEGQKRLRLNAWNTGFVQMALILTLITAEILIEVFRRRTIRSQRELELQAHEIQVAGEKLEHSKEKMFDIALTNILTGMKNRYALENDLADRLETDQFNIGVFDLDNFRAINDTYGYEFGDEFLATIGEMLSSEYSNVAEIYNITGNEFCFIFNDDVPDSQAQRIADKIRITMTTPIEIEGVVAQCGASGSIYHYLPNDSLNVSSLLIKMDTTLHNAKRNGGNMVYTVNTI